MLQGRGSRQVDECNCVGPLFLGGVDRLDNQWGLILASNPFVVLLGIHSSALNDMQANVNDTMVSHPVKCRACIRCANEEVCGQGFEAIDGMPICSHSLLICFTIFCCSISVFHN